MPTITTIILTLNEEKNIRQCLESAQDISDEIIVIDSGSQDTTLEIAREYGAVIHTRDFINQADQFNWALDNVEIKGEWILRLDADEYLTPELAQEIQDTLAAPKTETTGYYMKRRVYFLGRWIKHGGYYPIWFLRLWKQGSARIEDREMDEHTILKEGTAERFKHDFVDDNKNGLAHWIAKHNDYSTREARARIREEKTGATHASKKAQVKGGVYAKTPLFLRAFLYFLYRYIFLLGFLDGTAGLVFHTLQGFWHQFVIDAKIYENKRHEKNTA